MSREFVNSNIRKFNELSHGILSYTYFGHLSQLPYEARFSCQLHGLLRGTQAGCEGVKGKRSF